MFHPSLVWYRDNIERKYGVRGVAILLVWAILTFSFGVLCYSFRSYTQTIEGSLARFGEGTAWAVTGVGVAIVFIYVLVPAEEKAPEENGATSEEPAPKKVYISSRLFFFFKFPLHHHSVLSAPI